MLGSVDSMVSALIRLFGSRHVGGSLSPVPQVLLLSLRGVRILLVMLHMVDSIVWELLVNPSPKFAEVKGWHFCLARDFCFC